MNLPLESGLNTVRPGNFVAHPREGQRLTTEEVMASIESIGELRLVDARDEARFRGEIEPIDSVAGHIPGTLNFPYTASLHEEGTWKPQTALEALWRPVLGESRDTPWAVMCGSGVTACHLVISGLLAGYREPRLYVGSWSEWIRDPERPIATGWP
jgi:thiosulfate/3-mercaptopyruvate sulfurtransferase